ncbi:hypothetical protein DFJ74DRAFT_680439 [Hyaloraphidium curvatum]|nr:hypothetical protein DFJ74DRAFT_680439 [Hyaloraphidium curvatum]
MQPRTAKRNVPAAAPEVVCHSYAYSALRDALGIAPASPLRAPASWTDLGPESLFRLDVSSQWTSAQTIVDPEPAWAPGSPWDSQTRKRAQERAAAEADTAGKDFLASFKERTLEVPKDGDLFDNLSRLFGRFDTVMGMHDPTKGREPTPERLYLPTVRRQPESPNSPAENILLHRTRNADRSLSVPSVAATHAREPVQKGLSRRDQLRYADWMLFETRPRQAASAVPVASPWLVLGSDFAREPKRRKVDFDTLPKRPAPSKGPAAKDAPKKAVPVAREASIPQKKAKIAEPTPLLSEGGTLPVEPKKEGSPNLLPKSAEVNARTTESSPPTAQVPKPQVATPSGRGKLYGNTKIGAPIVNPAEKGTPEENPFVAAMVQRAARKETITKAPKVVQPASQPAANAFSLASLGAQVVDVVRQRRARSAEGARESRLPSDEIARQVPEGFHSKNVDYRKDAGSASITLVIPPENEIPRSLRASPLTPSPASTVSDTTAVNNPSPLDTEQPPKSDRAPISSQAPEPSQAEKPATGAATAPAPAAGTDDLRSLLPSLGRRRSRSVSLGTDPAPAKVGGLAASSLVIPAPQPASSLPRPASQGVTKLAKPIFGQRALAERDEEETGEVPPTPELNSYLPDSLRTKTPSPAPSGSPAQALVPSGANALVVERGIRVDQPVPAVSEPESRGEDGVGFFDRWRGGRSAASSAYSLSPEGKKGKGNFIGTLFGLRKKPDDAADSLDASLGSVDSDRSLASLNAAKLSAKGQKASEAKAPESLEGLPFDPLNARGVACLSDGIACTVRIDEAASTLNLVSTGPKKPDLARHLPISTRRLIRAVVVHRTVVKIYAQLASEVGKLKFDLGTAARAAGFAEGVNGFLCRESSSVARSVWVLVGEKGGAAEKIVADGMKETWDCAGVEVKIVGSLDKLPGPGSRLDVLLCMTDEMTMLHVLRRYGGGDPSAVAYDKIEATEPTEVAIKVLRDRPKCATWLLDYEYPR